jgi:hypothetical protein
MRWSQCKQWFLALSLNKLDRVTAVISRASSCCLKQNTSGLVESVVYLGSLLKRHLKHILDGKY